MNGSGSDALCSYRKLQLRLAHLRLIHLGHESPEEDALLEQMDATWWNMTSSERGVISQEPPLDAPICPIPGSPPLVDVDIDTEPGPVRRLAVA